MAYDQLFDPFDDAADAARDLARDFQCTVRVERESDGLRRVVAEDIDDDEADDPQEEFDDDADAERDLIERERRSTMETTWSARRMTVGSMRADVLPADR